MTLQRIRYREREVLTAATLWQEQAWRIAMHRRHAIAAHLWGVISGLALKADAGGLQIQPGYAVDGYGHELTLTDPVHVSAPELNAAAGAQGVAVWLLYSAVPGRGGNSCMPRIVEQPRLELTAFDAEIDSGNPGEVPETDLQFPPLFANVDDQDLRWPVYLGRVIAGGPNAFRIETDGRPLAGVVGQAIADPAGRAQMQVGTERSLFAVTAAGVKHIDVMTNGTSAISGPASILGDLRLMAAERSTDVPSGVALDPPLNAPEAAQPWSVYQTRAPLQQDGAAVAQLRFEIVDPGDKANPAGYRLTIGCRRAEFENFVPCMHIGADFNVLVMGNLTVEGELLEGPVNVNPDDPRLAQAVLDNYLDGITRGSSALDERYTDGIDINIVAGINSANVTLTNTGNADLTNWTAFLLAVRDEVAIVPSTQIGTGATLPARDSAEIVWRYPASLFGRLTIEVSAFAIAPPARVVQAVGRAVININTSDSGEGPVIK